MQVRFLLRYPTKTIGIKLTFVCVGLIVMSLAFSGISSAVLDPATAAAIWLFDNRNDLGKDSSKNAKEKLSTIWARLKAQ